MAIVHITNCRARERVYVLPTDAKPECRWIPDGTGEAVGYSCTACGRFVDAGSTTGQRLEERREGDEELSVAELDEAAAELDSIRARYEQFSQLPPHVLERCDFVAELAAQTPFETHAIEAAVDANREGGS